MGTGNFFNISIVNSFQKGMKGAKPVAVVVVVLTF